MRWIGIHCLRLCYSQGRRRRADRVHRRGGIHLRIVGVRSGGRRVEVRRGSVEVCLSGVERRWRRCGRRRRRRKDGRDALHRALDLLRRGHRRGLGSGRSSGNGCSGWGDSCGGCYGRGRYCRRRGRLDRRPTRGLLRQLPDRHADNAEAHESQDDAADAEGVGTHEETVPRARFVHGHPASLARTGDPC